MSKHARTTITVPPDLKARMDAVDEPVNWSALACQAFEQRLAEITKRKVITNMTDVVNRLRASKRTFEDHKYQEGHDAGKRWASNNAEAAELMRLAAWHHLHQPHCGPVDFTSAVWPEHEGDTDIADAFWYPHADDRSPTGAFVRGFADGALAIWDEVKDKL
jgi:hypothetical protein